MGFWFVALRWEWLYFFPLYYKQKINVLCLSHFDRRVSLYIRLWLISRPRFHLSSSMVPFNLLSSMEHLCWITYVLDDFSFVCTHTQRKAAIIWYEGSPHIRWGGSIIRMQGFFVEKLSIISLLTQYMGPTHIKNKLNNFKYSLSSHYLWFIVLS